MKVTAPVGLLSTLMGIGGDCFEVCEGLLTAGRSIRRFATSSGVGGADFDLPARSGYVYAELDCGQPYRMSPRCNDVCGRRTVLADGAVSGDAT